MQPKTLIYGYGNVGRKDDGLGVLCATELNKWLLEQNIKGVEVECNYQLNIEDAELISRYKTVFFIDASLEAEEAILLEEIEPDQNIIEFSMHAISPAYVLSLCQSMFNKKPLVYLLHIKGLEWDFVEGLSETAKENLETAIQLMKTQVSQVSYSV